MILDERSPGRLVRSPRPRLDGGEKLAAIPDGHGDARIEIAEQVVRLDACSQEVRGRGEHRLGDHRRVEPQVRVGGCQQAVQIDAVDDADRRRWEATCRGHPVDDPSVQPVVRLGGVELDDEMDTRQRPVEETLERDRKVEPAQQRPPGRRQHEKAIAVGDAELASNRGGVPFHLRLDEIETR